MKKKAFVLFLALTLATLGVVASARTWVSGESTTISFNLPDYGGISVMGYRDTSKINTSEGSYKEEHLGTDTWACINSFSCKLIRVNAWYEPNDIVDTSTTMGTTSNLGWNRGDFLDGQTLKSSFAATGYNGYSMTEQSNTYKE